ncbi:cellulose biosynthesis protein BcsN [Methylobacterium sp. C33D]
MRRAALRAAGLRALAWLLLPAAAQAQTVPVLSLPGAGALTAVIETRERDGFDQRLRYAGGDGRNHAEIALRRETADLLLAFPPRLAKPSEAGIAGEIAVRFPGQAMTVRPPVRNAYGPVGIALGADCLYAWQWIAGGRGGGGGQPPALFQAEPLARRAISLRIRLCRTAEASLGDLVRAVEGLRIALPGTRPPPALVRVPPRRAAPRTVVRRPSRPAAAEARKDETPPPRTPAASPPPVAVTPPATPPVAQPVAPPPSAASAAPDQKRYIVAPTPQAPAPVPPESGGQRYITEGSGSGIAPKPAPGQAPGETFFRDLPPEAYRPPN